jgi:hypothetical protein
MNVFVSTKDNLSVREVVFPLRYRVAIFKELVEFVKDKVLEQFC